MVMVDLSRWYELPFSSLRIGEIISRLSGLEFGPVNIARLEASLRGLGAARRFIPGLVERRMVSVDEGAVSRGEMLVLEPSYRRDEEGLEGLEGLVLGCGGGGLGVRCSLVYGC